MSIEDYVIPGSVTDTIYEIETLAVPGFGPLQENGTEIRHEGVYTVLAGTQKTSKNVPYMLYRVCIMPGSFEPWMTNHATLNSFMRIATTTRPIW